MDRKANPSDPTGPLNHALRVFVIDRAGNIRNIYSSGTLDVRLVLADVKTLLLEPLSTAAALTTAQATSKAGEGDITASKVEPAARLTGIAAQSNSQP